MTILVGALGIAIVIPVVSQLFILPSFSRRRLLFVGVLVSTLVAAGMAPIDLPIHPLLWRVVLGFGGVLASAIVFLAYDLLAAIIGFFVCTTLIGFLPLLRALEQPAQTAPVIAMLVPLALLLAYAVAGLISGKEVAYRYDDLAPHVRRIVERERVKAEIDAANRIQAALLPSRSPEIEGVTVASHYRSASEIGGDYFDFLPLPEGQIGIAFGDVAGHGLTSGIVMAMAKSALLVQVGYDHSPQRVMEVLNETVLKTAPKRMMMTFFFGVLNPATRQLRFSSAGHLDPYVYRAGSRKVAPFSVWGFPLGVRRRDPFREATAKFDTGDRLVLYSDGLIEAVDDYGEPFGFDRFESVLQKHGNRSAEEIKQDILDAVKSFTRNRPPEDDQTLVVVSFEELATSHAMNRASGFVVPEAVAN